MKPIVYPAVIIAAWLLVWPTTVPSAERSTAAAADTYDGDNLSSHDARFNT